MKENINLQGRRGREDERVILWRVKKDKFYL
jgi:hypothetical protein